MRHPAATLRVTDIIILAGMVGGLVACTNKPIQVTGWAVDWRQSDLLDATESLRGSGGMLRRISLFRYHLDPEGNLKNTGPLTEAHRTLAREASVLGAERFATVVNDVVGPDGRAVRLKDPELVHAILAVGERKRRLIEQLRGLILDEAYDGLDLDFENLLAEDRESFSSFVAELAEALHAEGKRLVVTVHPQARPEHRNGPGAQNLSAIAAHADEVQVMAYHVHYATTPPGPSAPISWLEQVIAYNLEHVPAAKLSLAVYVGGWRWQDGVGQSLGFSESILLAHELGTEIRWSEEHRVPFFEAQSPRGDVVVWFEDACSLLAKVNLAAAKGVRGIALWRLGNEDPELFGSLASKKCTPTRSRPYRIETKVSLSNEDAG